MQRYIYEVYLYMDKLQFIFVYYFIYILSYVVPSVDFCPSL